MTEDEVYERLLTGRLTIPQVRRQLEVARERQRAASAAARAAARYACDHLGMTEVAAAKALGVDRMTVRKARGKVRLPYGPNVTGR